MKIVRRLLSVITSVILIFFAAILLFDVQGNPPDQPIPLSVSLLIAVIPGAAQAWITFISWEPSGKRPNISQAVLGVALSSINVYVFVVLCIAASMINSHDGYFPLLRIAGAVVIALFWLLTTATNFMYFRRLIIEQASMKPNNRLESDA